MLRYIFMRRIEMWTKNKLNAKAQNFQSAMRISEAGRILVEATLTVRTHCNLACNG